MTFGGADTESWFDPGKRILDTMVDFEAIVTPGTGAVLFPPQPQGGQFRRNLHAASVASQLGLSSLDYAKRRYTTDDDDAPSANSSMEIYRRAFWDSIHHMHRTERELDSAGEDQIPMGIFAASIALERLESGIKSAHMLYRIGLNYEGDAVARYVLEQIAWSVEASKKETLDEIEKVKSQAAIGALKALIPWTGPLYGDLSKTTHAGLPQHQRAFLVDDSEKAQVLITWSRIAVCATHIMLLADAWAVAWEYTQAPYMKQFQSIASVVDRSPRPDREFMINVRTVIAAISKAEERELAHRQKRRQAK